MAADQDVFNANNGAPPGGPGWSWRWVKVRARTVYGNLSKLVPFAYPNSQYAGTTSHYDAETGASEQVSWRYVDSRQDSVDSPDNCICFKDMVLVWWEHFLATTDPKDVAAAIDRAKKLRKWPTAFAGTPGFEKGQ